MAPKKKEDVAGAPAAEFDVFAKEEGSEAAPAPEATAPEAAAPAPKAPKAAAPKKLECNEGCPKFHRPDADCVKCFNENFKRI